MRPRRIRYRAGIMVGMMASSSTGGQFNISEVLLRRLSSLGMKENGQWLERRTRPRSFVSDCTLLRVQRALASSMCHPQGAQANVGPPQTLPPPHRHHSDGESRLTTLRGGAGRRKHPYQRRSPLVMPDLTVGRCFLIHATCSEWRHDPGHAEDPCDGPRAPRRHRPERSAQ